MNEELKKIKKIYGEEMMHICRELFPSIIEHNGLLYGILIDNLAPTHSFAEDIREQNLYDQFKNWIYGFVEAKDEDLLLVDKTPFQLLDEKGYTLYECKTEEDIQSFKKFYEPNEVICTIKNGGRLARCHVFFAVKKNVLEIKRENFPKPDREDEYGRSVISIQFTKGMNNSLMITNRYNHTVDNPDFTFYNNLEYINRGLTRSFEHYYNLNIGHICSKQDYFMHSHLKYIKADDGKFYRYNIELDGVYFCENNIIIKDGKVITKYADNKERYILVEQYVIDLKEKKIIALAGIYKKHDAFVKSINDVDEIKNIEVIRKNDDRTINIYYSNDKKVMLKINKNNQLVEYENNHVTFIDDEFLEGNNNLQSITLDNVNKIKSGFLCNNRKLSKISLENVIDIGDYFLSINRNLEEISLPNVETVGDRFISSNEIINKVYFPKLKEIHDSFLLRNNCLEEISLPQVEIIRDNFLSENQRMKIVNIPNVEYIGKWFLSRDEKIESISLPKVKVIGDYFIRLNRILKEVSLPQVEKIGDNFLKYNYFMNSIELPNVKEIGDDFLYSNCHIIRVHIPKVIKIGKCFMYSNISLSSISLPNLEEFGSEFLFCNSVIKPNSLLKM